MASLISVYVTSSLAQISIVVASKLHCDVKPAAQTRRMRSRTSYERSRCPCTPLCLLRRVDSAIVLERSPWTRPESKCPWLQGRQSGEAERCTPTIVAFCRMNIEYFVATMLDVAENLGIGVLMSDSRALPRFRILAVTGSPRFPYSAEPGRPRGGFPPRSRPICPSQLGGFRPSRPERAFWLEEYDPAAAENW